MGALQKFLKQRHKQKSQPDQFSVTAADLATRAERLRAGHLANGMSAMTTDTTYSTAELIDSIAKFVKTLGAASAAADRVDQGYCLADGDWRCNSSDQRGPSRRANSVGIQSDD